MSKMLTLLREIEKNPSDMAKRKTLARMIETEDWAEDTEFRHALADALTGFMSEENGSSPE